MNDKLQFPAFLDMAAFTKDGRENQEHQTYKVDDDLTEHEKRHNQRNEARFSDMYDFASSSMRLVRTINPQATPTRNRRRRIARAS